MTPKNIYSALPAECELIVNKTFQNRLEPNPPALALNPDRIKQLALN